MDPERAAPYGLHAGVHGADLGPDQRDPVRPQARHHVGRLQPSRRGLRHRVVSAEAGLPSRNSSLKDSPPPPGDPSRGLPLPSSRPSNDDPCLPVPLLTHPPPTPQPAAP